MLALELTQADVENDIVKIIGVAGDEPFRPTLAAITDGLKRDRPHNSELAITIPDIGSEGFDGPRLCQ